MTTLYDHLSAALAALAAAQEELKELAKQGPVPNGGEIVSAINAAVANVKKAKGKAE